MLVVSIDDIDAKKCALDKGILVLLRGFIYIIVARPLRLATLQGGD